MCGIDQFDKRWENSCELVIKQNKKYSDILEKFSVDLSNLSITSATVYVRIISRFLSFINKPLEEIDCYDYKLFMKQFKLKTPQYQIQIYQALKRFSYFLCKSRKAPIDYMIDEDVPVNRKAERVETKKKREHGYLTETEIKSCIYNAGHGVGKAKSWNVRNEAIVRLLLATGIRVSALYKLDVSDVTFHDNGGSIKVREKGNKEYECVFGENVAEALRAWLTDRNEKLIGFPEADKDALFISKVRRRMTQQAVSDLTRNVAIKEDGTRLSPHKLRATFGTFLYNQTHDIYLCQNGLHHDSPKTTEKYIRGVEDDTNKRIMSAISY